MKMKYKIGPYVLSRLEYYAVRRERESGKYIGALMMFRMGLPEGHDFESTKQLFDDDSNWQEDPTATGQTYNVNVDTGESSFTGPGSDPMDSQPPE